VTGQFNEVGVY